RKPSSSCRVGTSPFGFMARYSVSRFLPKAPPTSMRSCGRPSSPTAHITFCTLDDVLRPQILSIGCTPVSRRHAREGGHPALRLRCLQLLDHPPLRVMTACINPVAALLPEA